MEQIRLDIIPKGLMPVCHSSQYDKGRVIRLNLVDGLQGYTLTDETVTLNVRKPDNNIVTAGVNVVSGASYVDIVTTEQMTACEGENLCEIVITKGDVKIASLNFKMKVEVDPLKDGIESETEIHNLETQIAEIDAEIVPPIVAEEVANQYDSENVIFDDTPTASHGTGYTVTSEGIKNYVDNKPNALVDLTDVDIDNPTSNQALVWDTTEQKWKNGEVSTVGSIDDLDDVDTTGKIEGDNLRYDGNEWVAKPNTIEMTLAEWNAIADKQTWRNAHKITYLVITDAPNLNETAKQISYDGGTDTVWDEVEEKADITALPFVKYEEINVALDSTGEGTLFTSSTLVVGIKDIPSDSLYVGYAVYFAGSQTKCKAISRNALAFTSSGIISQTRKIGVWYLDNINIT